MANCKTCEHLTETNYCKEKRIFIIDESPRYCEQHKLDEVKYSIERNTFWLSEESKH